MSHTLTVLSKLHDAASLPSDDADTPRTSSVCPLSTCSHRPLPSSHTRTSLSWLHDTTLPPPMLTPRTTPECPSSVRSCDSPLMSHTITVMSCDPDTTLSPSALTATLLTAPVCLFSPLMCFPVLQSQTSTCFPWPLTTRPPSGDNATHDTSPVCLIFRTSFPDIVHSLSVPSRPPDAANDPFGVTATPITQSLCPWHLLSCSPDPTSHTLTVPSTDPLTARPPSDVIATSSTSFSCPVIAKRFIAVDIIDPIDPTDPTDLASEPVLSGCFVVGPEDVEVSSRKTELDVGKDLAFFLDCASNCAGVGRLNKRPSPRVLADPVLAGATSETEE